MDVGAGYAQLTKNLPIACTARHAQKLMMPRIIHARWQRSITAEKMHFIGLLEMQHGKLEIGFEVRSQRICGIDKDTHNYAVIT